MKNIAMSKLLSALLLAIGLLSIQAQAFDLGKALEDAAKQTIENSKKSEEVMRLVACSSLCFSLFCSR